MVPCTHSTLSLFHGYRSRPDFADEWWVVDKVKDMRTVDGKREWLVAWAGVDNQGRAWAPTWEP